jgi:tetratricopeptide (TPR) repeat protein
MHSQSLKLREKVLGPQHPDTLRSINNLAQALRDQGKYQMAEEIQRQALELSEKVLGLEHPDTLTIMNNLARILWRDRMGVPSKCTIVRENG